MTTCMYCGSEIPETAKFCTNCGAALPVEAPVEQPVFETPAPQEYQQPYQQPAQQPTYQQPYAQPAAAPVVDSGSIGWGILGFFFPIVGLILFFVWKDKKPQSAKVAIIGAAIGFVLGIIANIATGAMG